jgi:hypothetical protein
MPEAEMWTFFGSSEIKGPVKRIGVNFGAPGDRRADDGTLWVEHPNVGGKSPAAPIALDGTRVEYFRRHSSRIAGTGLPWVSASGVKGITSLTLMLDKEAKADQPYLVRLHFVEPDGLKPEQRVFDVLIQGKEVLKDFDIAREAGGPDRALVREFTVDASKEVKVKFVPRRSAPILCGIEAVQGGQLSAAAQPAQNVVHSDLTVPESAVLLKPAEEPRMDSQDATLKAFLWIAIGAMLFMWVFYRFALVRGRSA